MLFPLLIDKFVIHQKQSKMRKLFPLFTIGMIFLCLSSCVSKKKHSELKFLKDHYKVELDSLRTQYGAGEDGEERFTEYDFRRNEAQLKQAAEDLGDLQESFDYLKIYNDDILKRYDELLEQNRDLLNSSSSDAQQLVAQMSAKQQELDRKNRELERLKYEMDKLTTEFAHETINTPPPPPTKTIITNDCTQYERQVAELNNLLREKDSRLHNLRTTLNKALHGFTNSDLTVTENNGKIYVSLSQNLLFASNSDKIDWKGKTAIKSVADVLNRNPDIQIEVEGHTDSDGSAAKNWDLSVRRATAVTKVLTTYKVDPKRITASGRSFYFPVASNATAAGKAKNRRTEIILSPKLDELYRIINQ